jgi:xanthine dehydrogenase small subunit
VTAYLQPTSLDQALRLRREHPDYTVLAGGTDLLVASTHRPDPPGVIDLFGLAPLVGIAESEGAISIGAATTYAAILASDVIRRELPSLSAAAREVGALQIQARGTLGGNIGTSSPVGDTLPVLLALDAIVELASEERGRRELAYESFLTGYRRTALAPDELIVRVHIPARPDGAQHYWRKMGTRRAQSISKVMVAGCAQVSGGVLRHIRLGLGAVADRPLRARAAETALLGLAPGPDAAERAREALAGELHPIDDIRSTASYRLAAAQNAVARFVETLAGT